MEEKIHNLILENRTRLSVSSCSEVVSFNENEVNLVAEGSLVTVKGINLKVEEVSKQSGEAVIVGESIDSIVYSKHLKGSKEGLLRRILK